MSPFCQRILYSTPPFQTLRSTIINISLCLILLPTVLEAQKVKKDTASQSFATKYLPTGIRFGTDAFALVRNTYDETFKGWELNADVDFYRYYLTVDYGYWGRNFEGRGNVYDNDGTYFRAGVDVNFLTKDPDRNMFFVGARYGRS